MNKVVATMAFLALVAAPAASFAKGSTTGKGASKAVSLAPHIALRGQGSCNVGPSANDKPVVKKYDTGNLGMVVETPTSKANLDEDQAFREQIKEHIAAGIKASDAQPKNKKRKPGDKGYPFAPGHDTNPFK